MVGWVIGDNGGNDSIPSLNISAHGFVVVAASEYFYENHSDYNSAIVFVEDGKIGSNGLSNSGDCLILADSQGNVIDELSYGNNDDITSPPYARVDEGHSMERQPAGGSFVDNSQPTPGYGLPPPTPTPTPTQSPEPSPTASPTPAVPGTVANRSDILINEIQYNPPQSGSESAYEWLELYNTLDRDVSLNGWRISDNYSSDPIPGVNISPHGFVVVAASPEFSENHPDYTGTVIFIEDGRIGNGLGNSGDSLILRDSDDNVIDALSYGDDDSITSNPFKKVGEGHSMERVPVGGEFADNSNPTPGEGLSDAEPVPEESPASTNESTGTVAEFGAVLINEIQNNPVQPGSDTSYEWVEIYNTGNESITLEGWRICDNRAEDAVPELILPAKGLAIVAASENYSVNFPDYDRIIVFVADGRIGNGLGNGGDCVVLKDSAGTVIDEVAYGDYEGNTSLPWSEVGDGHSLERKPCGGDFIDNDMPTPGHCLPEAVDYADEASAVPVAPASDEDDSAAAHQQQSEDMALPLTGKAHMSSSQEESGEFPGVSLGALLVTLFLSLIATLGWMLYRRKSG